VTDLPPGFVEDDAPPPPAGFVLDPHPTKPAEEPPGAVETFFRKASNAVSSNFVNPIAAGVTHLINGQPYQEALKDINATDEAGAAAHPIASTAGTIAGTGLQIAAPIPLPKGTTALGHAAAGAAAGAGFGAVGAAGDAVNAGGDAGDALKAAGKGAAVGAAVGGALGAVTGKLVRSAPERVEDRIVANITRGEAGGASKPALADKLVAKAKAGEVMPELERTGLTKTVATQAAAAPAKVADKVTTVIDEYTAKRLDPIYAAIDKHGAGPTAFDLKYKLLQLSDRLRESGEAQQAASVDRYAKFLDKAYADGKQLTASAIRKLRSEVGLGNTFASAEEAALPAGIAAKRAIYGAFNDAIEGAAARTPGVDVAQLKAANKTVSTLLAVRDTLANRATKAAKGGTGFGTAVTGAVLRGAEGVALGSAVLHALSTGDLGALGHVAQGIAATEGARYAITHALPQVARRADYGLSRLELGARSGDLASRAGRALVEGGAARVIAPKASRSAGSFLSPARDDE